MISLLDYNRPLIPIHCLYRSYRGEPKSKFLHQVACDRSLAASGRWTEWVFIFTRPHFIEIITPRRILEEVFKGGSECVGRSAGHVYEPIDVYVRYPVRVTQQLWKNLEMEMPAKDV